MVSSLRSKQIGLLYGRVTVGLAATSINAVILTIVLWTWIDRSVLLGWLACVELVVLLRYVILLKYQLATRGPDRDRSGLRWFLIGTALAGFGWGSAGIFLFTPNSLAHQTFLAFVLGGMTAGAVTTYSSWMPAAASFIFPASLPIILRFFAEGDQIHLAMGAMALLFLILMVDSSWRVHQTTLKSLNLEADNTDLIGRLTVETERVKHLNNELIQEIAERRQIEQDLTKARDTLEQRVAERTVDLQQALDKVKVLRGLLPICSSCKKIRNDQGYWTQLEVYIHQHAEVEFTHGLCPECAEELFSGFVEEIS